MIDLSTHWEQDYTRRGRLWGGAVYHLMELSDGVEVLELGCGNGNAVSSMLRKGWNVTALDFSPTAIALNRRATVEYPNGKMVIADARALPFRDGSFDAAFAVHIIGHLPKSGRLQVASEVSRVLRSGGKMFFSEFSHEDIRYNKGTEMEPSTFRRGAGIITHYFTEQEAVDLFYNLNPLSAGSHRWKMRVHGVDLIRAEIQVLLVKP